MAFQLPSLNEPGGNSSKPETQPLVVGPGRGVTNLPTIPAMFMGTNHGLVALDPTNGDIVWAYKGARSKAGALLPGYASATGARAISYGDGMVFGGQQDGSLVAVDARTGAAVWTIDTEAAGTAAEGGVYSDSNPWSVFDPARATSWSSGSQLGKDLVVAAPNGGESPLRGHFDAYDARTGQLVWRTWTTPDPTQIPFILSWGNPAEAATGGSAAWSLPAIDNQLASIYFGTGNEYPEFGSSPGKKLWTDSLMSVSLRTGALRWYFQTIHHEEWDLDVANPPVRIDPIIDGKRIPLVAVGGKSGYLYVLNARNGGRIPNFAIPEVAVPDINQGAGQALNNTWPTQPEPTGGAGHILPHCMTAAEGAMLIPGYPTAPNGTPIIPTCQYAPPTAAAYNLMYPAETGGINWNREAYDPATNDLYVCASISAQGRENLSSTNPDQQSIGPPGLIAGGTITALDISTNKIDWQVRIPPPFTYPGGPDIRNGTCFSGDLTTAGGLVFVAENVGSFTEGTPRPIPGVLFAFDARTGKQLWRWKNSEGSVIRAQAMTYMANGKQYIAVMATSPNQGPNATTSPTDHLTVFSLSRL